MLLLSADALLLFFITLNLGILTRKILANLFASTIHADLLALFLLGLLTSSVYFNIVSFWLPVNYLSLIPLILLSGVISYTHRDEIRFLRQSILQHIRYFSAPSRLLTTMVILAILFYYWILPPGNVDSRGYHYLSILWYEKYKVVPGLANIHGRFAFNPVSFIIQAAYSFTAPVGQSLYPLNGVLMALFSGWVLVRLFRAGASPVALVYTLLFIMLLRPLLINISSPTSDTLVAVCITYALVRIFEMAISDAPEDRQLSYALVPCIIIVYSLTAKLSSFPALLVLPIVFYWLPKKEKGLSLLGKTSLVALFLYVPWLARNYILSGYLVYPIPSLGWWHPDWQAPLGLLKLEQYFIGVGAKTNSSEVLMSTPLPLYHWFIGWFTGFFKLHSYGDPFLFVLSICSPLYWFLLDKNTHKASVRPLLLWLSIYAGVWIWLLTSPVVRFGSVLLCLSTALPFLVFFYHRPRQQKTYQWLIRSLFIFSAIFYISSGYSRVTTYSFTLKDCWLYPLKDISYNYNKNGMGDFLYRPLAPGINLFIGDHRHLCMNTCLPCMVCLGMVTPCYFDDIEMRGARIDDGFRMIRDDLSDTYPFIK